MGIGWAALLGLPWLCVALGSAGMGSDPSAPEPGGAGSHPGAAESPVLGALVWIPAGAYTRGSPVTEPGRQEDEVQHPVTLTRGFWMMEREVSQRMWEAVMGRNPSTFHDCLDCPVEQVSWVEAVAFAGRLSVREGATYRLPTEAEWEYAARGAAPHRYAGSDDISAVGWVYPSSQGRTHPGCEKARNGFRLCDMSGNVSEWTADGYAAYPFAPVVDPSVDGEPKVVRGGGWDFDAQLARVAYRGRYASVERSFGLGFRLVRTAP